MKYRLNLLDFLTLIVSEYITSIRKHDISQSYFSDGAKNTLVTLLYL